MWRLILLLVFLAAGCELAKGPAMPGIDEGNIALPVEGFDSSGKKISLEQLRGKVVLLSFWASWCKPCIALIPHEAALAKKLEGQPFTILGVNGDRNPDAQSRAEEKLRMTWPSISDASGFLSSKWEIDSIPVMYVVDQKGIIRFSSKKVIDRIQSFEELSRRVEKEVETLLKEGKKPG